MTKPKWTESKTCQSRTRCDRCRDPGALGQAFRQGLAVQWEVEPGLFACPHGVRGGWGLGDVVERVIHIVGLDRLVRGRRCGCQKRKVFLNRVRLPFSGKGLP